MSGREADEMALPTDLYGALHHARESLCIAQTRLPAHSAKHRDELQDCLDTIDRIGVFHCSQWSKYDEPDLAEQDGGCEHECVFVEEREPSGRLILPPCIVCGLTAMDALDKLRSETNR